MADNSVASADSLSHDSGSDRERCRTKEPPGPQATLRRTSGRNKYMQSRRHHDAGKNKLALRTRQKPHQFSEEVSPGVDTIAKPTDEGPHNSAWVYPLEKYM